MFFSLRNITFLCLFSLVFTYSVLAEAPLQQPQQNNHTEVTQSAKNDQKSLLDQPIDPKNLTQQPTDPKKPKKTSRLWKILHHYIAGGPAIIRGCIGLLQALYPKSVFEKEYPNKPSLEVQEVVDAVFHKMGLNPEDIHTGVHPQLPLNSPAVAIGKQFMGITPDAAKKLDEEFEFTVAHEAVHLKNHDTLYRGCALVSLPFAVHFGTTWYDQRIQKLLTLFKNKEDKEDLSLRNQRIEKLKKAHNFLLTNCVSKWLILWYLYGKYAQYQEKRADMQAAQTLGANHARAGANLFANFGKKMFDAMCDARRTPGMSDEEFAKFKSYFKEVNSIPDNYDNPWYSWFENADHPHHSERARYLNEYADKLEAAAAA